MKKNYYFFVCLYGCFLISFSATAETISNAKINKIMINKSLGDKVFLDLDIAHSLTTPTCHANNTWDFVLPLTSSLDEKIYAILVTAWAAGTEVTLYGTGACGDHYNIESIDRIDAQ